MKGPHVLNVQNILDLPSVPGAYLLIKHGSAYVYVGRSDKDLKETLQHHLPQNEDNPYLKKTDPDHFCYERASSIREAYEIECKWYHEFSPNCNTMHPDRPYPFIKCPVCGE